MGKEKEEKEVKKKPICKETAKEYGRIGGIKSGEVKRRKADILGYIEKELLTEDDEGLTKDARIAKVLIELCIKGDMVAIKETLDRVHGKVKDTVDMKADEKIIISWEDDDDAESDADSNADSNADSEKE